MRAALGLGRRRGGRAPFRLLSRLLQYPDERLAAARGEVDAAIAGVTPADARRELTAFWAHAVSTPLLALQQEYVDTFDLQKGSTLHLTYYSDGDTRKRGMGLVNLKRSYAAAGLRLEPPELPDFLPVLLEFAELEPEAGTRLLREHRAGLEMLRLSLAGRSSAYGHLVQALLAWMPPLSVPDRAAVDRLLRDGAPSEAVGLEPFAPGDVMPVGDARR